MKGTTIILGVAGLAGLGALTYVGVRTDMARTIRLNNPGALRINAANDWQGKVTPSSDKEFEQFVSPIYGARAMLRTLRTHYQRGENTVGWLINYWTPDNRAAYVAHVIKNAGLTGSGFFTWEKSTVTKIAKAMADWEAGVPWFSLNLFEQAWGIM